MNAERLLEHYERIADAPDAIARLRRFILDLAVRGKVVPQDPTDEPASELLQRIGTEKARMVKAGEIGKQEPFRPIADADIMFRVPKTWEWVPATFPAYVVSDMGKKVQTKEVLESGDFPVVDQGKVFIRGYCNDPDKVVRVKAPLILFGDHTRETKLIDFDFVVGADGVKLLQPVCLFTRYYYLALQWLPLDSRGYGRHFKLLRASLIPVPPLAEQRRIVAKVDELMALCDRLEAARVEQEATRDRLVSASLARLSAPDPATFQEHAHFVLDTLPALTTRPDQINQLRQTILNLAVRGKLVPQDPNDEPAAELLKRIAAEKVRLLRDRNSKAKMPIARDGSIVAFELPMSWAWCQLDEISWKITDGDHLTPTRETTGHYLLSARNVQNGRIDLSDVDFVGDVEFNRMRKRCDPNMFDLLISCSGSVGRVTIVDKDETYVMVRSAALVKPVFAGELAPFLARALISECLQIQMDLRSKAAAQPNLFIAAIRQLMLPLPPLAEQHRIVAKVDALMALCDRLETSLDTIAATRRRLLDSLLHDALAPAEDREMEAAE